MIQYENRDNEVGKFVKSLMYDFMQSIPKCQANAERMRLAEIFRKCDFDWGDYLKATSSNQREKLSISLNLLLGVYYHQTYNKLLNQESKLAYFRLIILARYYFP